jgi:transcriptional regulator with XRE-family HTH domain
MRARVNGLVLREFRQQRGWTQERLAEAAELDSYFIYQLETGRRGGSLETAAALGRALGVSFHLLIAQPQKKEAAPTTGP